MCLVNIIYMYTKQSFLVTFLVGSMMDIKSVYKVQKGNWQGDPCAPQAYAWDGIGCRYNDSDSLRITSLYVVAYNSFKLQLMKFPSVIFTEFKV